MRTRKPRVRIADVLASVSGRCADFRDAAVSVVLSQRSHSTLSRYTARQQLLVYLPAPASGRSIDDHGRVDETGEGVQVRAVPPGPSVQAGDDTIKAIFSAFIPSLKQTRTALLREDQGDKDKGTKRRSVELWHCETKLGAIDVTEIHAAFIVDGQFCLLAQPRGRMLISKESPQTPLALCPSAPSQGSEFSTRPRQGRQKRERRWTTKKTVMKSTAWMASRPLNTDPV